MADITITNVCKKYGSFTAVEDFSLDIKNGEFISLLGPSGCGKTTLLRSIAGFFMIDNGEIRIGDRIVESFNERTHIPPEDRNIGMVFQSYAVWPHMNVFDNLAYPLKIRKMPSAVIKEKVETVLELLNLPGSNKKHPSEMSGGQQQRIALGRALVMDPEVLLLDEPLSNLDSKLRERMRFELKEIQQRLDLTILYVTHDQEEAMAVSDRIVLMNRGKIQQTDTPRDLYSQPDNLFSARFMGRSNLITGSVSEHRDDLVMVKTVANAVIPLKPAVKVPYSKGASVTAVIRYEKVEISGLPDSETVTGRIIVGTYFGSYFLYAVETEFGECIAHTDSFAVYTPGDSVYLKFSGAYLFAG